MRLRILMAAPAALLALGAAATLPAQAPPPFASTPSDAMAMVRVDLQTIGNVPAFQPMMREIAQMEPNFRNAAFGAISPVLGGGLTPANAETLILEASVFMEDDEPEVVLVAYGRFQPGSIFESITAAGAEQGPEVEGRPTLRDADGALFTMPNDWTMILAPNEALMRTTLATLADPQNASVHADPELAAFATASAGSLFAANLGMVGPVREAASQFAANPPGELMMIPGAVPVVRDLGRMESVGLFYSPTTSAFQVVYDSPESAAAGGPNLKNALLGMTQLSMMQTGPTPEAQRQLEALRAADTTPQGSTVRISTPVTPGDLEMIAAMAPMLMMAMQEEAGAAAAGGLIPPAQRAEFPNFNTPDIRGEMIDLADYRGKVVVIDYWATWCGPCRATKPHLVQMHSQVQPQGVEFIGVSLDQNMDALRSYIEQNNMPWRQVTDLQGWGSIYAQAMGVNSIPHIFVLDRQGRIAARGGLRGQELEMVVAQVLAEQ